MEMKNLYINYKKTEALILEGYNLYLNMHKLPRTAKTTYVLDDNTLIRLFGKKETHIDEKTLSILCNLKTESIALPKNIIYTIDNAVMGYTYKRIDEEEKNYRIEKVTDIVSSLKTLKNDAIKLGSNNIYIDKLNEANTRNLKIITPENFRQVHNNHNQIVKNIDEINDYYFRNIFKGDNRILAAMVDDYTKGNYYYIGDYLTDTMFTTCNEEEYEKSLSKVLKIDK